MKAEDRLSKHREAREVTSAEKYQQLLLFGTRAHLLSPEEGSCYILSIRSNCCESLASYGVIFESDFQPYFKTPVYGATFSTIVVVHTVIIKIKILF